MAWAKLDDRLPFHPRVVAAGNEAVGAWARMLAYCAGYATDGHVPETIARAIASPATLDRLCEVGSLERRGDGYLVHDYLDYNPSRAEAAALARTRAEVGRRGAGKRWGDGKADSKPDGKRDGKAMADPDPDPDPDPSDLIPPPPPSPPPTGSRPAAARPDLPHQVRSAFTDWAAVMGKNGATRLTAQRRRRIEARLREGYTLADIADAVRGCRASRFHMGENSSGRVYTDIELICRDGVKLEGFRDAYRGAAKPIDPTVARAAALARAEEARHGR